VEREVKKEGRGGKMGEKTGKVCSILGLLGLLALLLELHLKVLAALESALELVATDSALITENHLLGGLCLLVEDGLGLTTETLLLAVVTTLALSHHRLLALLVLRDLVQSVLAALLARAESTAGLGDRNHLILQQQQK